MRAAAVGILILVLVLLLFRDCGCKIGGALSGGESGWDRGAARRNGGARRCCHVRGRPSGLEWRWGGRRTRRNSSSSRKRPRRGTGWEEEDEEDGEERR